jgi:hypothetical protein
MKDFNKKPALAQARLGQPFELKPKTEVVIGAEDLTLRQDEVLVVGAASLLVYALVRNDNIVAFAMAGVMLIAGRELIQIMRGKHHHTTGDIQRYEHPESNT